jgi:hypothetical protein
MSDDEHWSPRCELPVDLVRPARIDASGVTGPTRGEAQRGGWRQSSHGWHVPAEVDPSRVEQRILEQAMRARRDGAVTGWAALRWRGAHYFDGTANGRGGLLPVPLLRGSGARARRLDDGRAQISRSQLAPRHREFVRGLWCTTGERAVFDEVARRGRLRPAVAAICMALAARVRCLDELHEFARTTGPWEGIPLFRDALALSDDCFRSGPEVYMYLRWILDAGLPRPLVNVPIFDLDGRLLGYPDLLDPLAGVIGEYDGAAHKRRGRHRRDVAREERYRAHGLEYFTVVAGDLANEYLVVERMCATRRRAKFLPAPERQWTLTPPPWWTPPLWLPARYSAANIIDTAS